MKIERNEYDRHEVVKYEWTPEREEQFQRKREALEKKIEAFNVQEEKKREKAKRKNT